MSGSHTYGQEGPGQGGGGVYRKSYEIFESIPLFAGRRAAIKSSHSQKINLTIRNPCYAREAISQRRNGVTNMHTTNGSQLPEAFGHPCG